MTDMTNNTTTSSEIDEQIEKLKLEEADALKTINDQHERIFKIKENIKLLQRSKLFCVGVKPQTQVSDNDDKVTEQINGGAECQESKPLPI